MAVFYLGIQSPCQRMIGVSNHLRNAKYLASMKPFSVSVSQDLLGMAKIGRVNIHYSIIRIYHTFCFWIPKDCHLSTTNLPSFHFPTWNSCKVDTGSVPVLRGAKVGTWSPFRACIFHGISGCVKPQTLHFLRGLHMGATPKMVGFPNKPMGFPTKNDHDLGCEMAVPPFKETPI